MPLSALEGALQAWLREQLPLPAEVGDVSFDSPDAGWGDALTRPTVNLFLFDISRAAQQSVPMPARRDQGGTLVRDRPAPSVAFSYLLSTWGADVREEHRLLGNAVQAVLRTPALSPGPESQDLVGPVMIRLSEANDVRARELWSGLGGRLRAGLVLVVMTAVPLERPTPLATPVETVRAEVIRSPDRSPAASATDAALSRDSAPVEGSVLEDESPRRFVWFGPRKQRGRGRP